MPEDIPRPNKREGLDEDNPFFGQNLIESEPAEPSDPAVISEKIVQLHEDIERVNEKYPGIIEALSTDIHGWIEDKLREKFGEDLDSVMAYHQLRGSEYDPNQAPELSPEREKEILKAIEGAVNGLYNDRVIIMP